MSNGPIPGRVYAAVCICLILAAAGLRFHDLTAHGLSMDEAVAANNSRGTLPEVLFNTRYYNSSPILHPLILHAVQKIESSTFSIRVVPAGASVLTVAVLLLLLPRAGVGRWTAFTAGLLAAVSDGLIRQAQDGREYSVDALVASLIMIGLLRHVGDVKKTSLLLCASLFIGPLLQYGLFLFGLAALATLTVTCFASKQPQGGARKLVWPAACFLGGSAVSHMVTLRHQWKPAGWGRYTYLQDHYYSGGIDASSLAYFMSSRTWGTFNWLMPETFALFGAAAFGVFLVLAIRKGGLHPIPMLFLFSLAAAMGAAALRAYPLGGIRQSTWLAPAVFLGLGYAVRSLADELSVRSQRAWPAHAAMALIACGIALEAIGDVKRLESSRKKYPVESILRDVGERTRGGDAAYVQAWPSEIAEFYHRGRRDDTCYRLGRRAAEGFRHCVSRLLERQPPPRRMWVVARGDSWGKSLFTEPGRIEHVHDYGKVDLHLVENLPLQAREIVAAVGRYRSVWRAAADREPGARCFFDVHHRNGELVYVKEPCNSGNVNPKFFLHVYPRSARDLPEHRRQSGFDDLGFDFPRFGMVLDGKCVVVRDLPGYRIRRLHTGQIILPDEHDDAPEAARLWAAELPGGRCATHPLARAPYSR